MQESRSGRLACDSFDSRCLDCEATVQATSEATAHKAAGEAEAEARWATSEATARNAAAEAEAAATSKAVAANHERQLAGLDTGRCSSRKEGRERCSSGA